MKVLNPKLVSRLYHTYQDKLHIAKNPDYYHKKYSNQYEIDKLIDEDDANSDSDENNENVFEQSNNSNNVHKVYKTDRSKHTNKQYHSNNNNQTNNNYNNNNNNKNINNNNTNNNTHTDDTTNMNDNNSLSDSQPPQRRTRKRLNTSDNWSKAKPLSQPFIIENTDSVFNYSNAANTKATSGR